ncbi:MalY/PatB family protein [Enterococcus hirae]|nr:MalY/PatB family protein [Enterococcus hirae]
MEMEEFVERYAVDRLATASLKWDALKERFGDADLIAMWVADMEFKTPEVVQEALHERVDHGVFGYTTVPDSYYQALIDWQKKRHGTVVQKEWVRFAPGVVPALHWMVRGLTNEGDAIMIQSPVYYPFHNVVKDNHRKLVRSELKSENGRYFMDLEDFEEKIITEHVKMFIFCSPANPVGRVWSAEEVAAVLEICRKHAVLVISDEIHQDIILGGRKFTSSLSAGNGAYHKNLIVCTAPSKTFNLACLLNAHVVIPDAELRERYDEAMKTLNQVENSVMGQIACEAAYRGGEDWLEGLLATIEHNFNYLKENLNEYAPKIVVTELEGTYLAWLDLSTYVPNDEIKDFIQNKSRLAIDFGEWFSDQSKGCVRLNMATDPKYIEMAVENIITEVRKLNKK